MSPDTRIVSHDATKKSELDLQGAETNLLTLWVDDFDNKCVLPTHNKPAFLSTLLDAKTSSKPIILLAIACLDWQPAPDGQNPNVDRVISPIFSDNKRAKRVAEGFLQLQQALNSFGIKSEVTFTFSDVEAIMTARLGNMGQRLFNVDLERDIKISLDAIFNNARANGVSLSLFRHLETLKRAKHETDLRKLQQLLTNKENPDFHELLSSLYKFDLVELPNIIGQGNPVIWLNLISRDFMEHIEEVQNLSTGLNPNLAIVTPFVNAGSWSTAPVGQAPFVTKKELASQMLNIDAHLENSSWLRTVIGISDERVNGFLEALGIKFVVSNSETKAIAVNLIGQLMFGKQLEKAVHTQVHEEVSIARFLKMQLNINSARAADLIKHGGVTINGEVIKEPGYKLTSRDRFTIGVSHKTTFIVN